MNISISNTNGNSKQYSCVRAYANGFMVAELQINKRNPLGYLQDKLSSKYIAELDSELTRAMEEGKLTHEMSCEIKRRIFPKVYA